MMTTPGATTEDAGEEYISGNPTVIVARPLMAGLQRLSGVTNCPMALGVAASTFLPRTLMSAVDASRTASAFNAECPNLVFVIVWFFISGTPSPSHHSAWLR